MNENDSIDFIDDLDFEKLKAVWNSKRKTEFNFDEWCKDIDSHPMFMNSLPTSGKLSEAMEALQAMKYDADSSLEEQALVYKEDGNYSFKNRDYEKSLIAFTEGIKLRCSDEKLNAELHNNRSAAHFYLGNFRSSFKDCLSARKFDPNHLKAFKRGLECLLNLKCPEEAVRWIEEAPSTLKESMNNIKDYQTRINRLIKEENKKKRKLRLDEIKHENERQKLVQAFKKRNLHFRHCTELDQMKMDSLIVSLANCEPSRVHLSNDDDSSLVWPVLFLYPEYGTTDFIAEFDERSTFSAHLSVMFNEKPAWDVENKYQIENLRVYFENFQQSDSLVSVPLNLTLKEALSHLSYGIVQGLPSFIVLTKYSEYLSRFVVNTFS